MPPRPAPPPAKTDSSAATELSALEAVLAVDCSAALVLLTGGLKFSELTVVLLPKCPIVAFS